MPTDDNYIAHRSFVERGVLGEVQVADYFYVGICGTVSLPEDEPNSMVVRRGNDAIDRLGIDVDIIRSDEKILKTKMIITTDNSTSSQSMNINRRAWIRIGDDIQAGDYIFDIKRSIYYILLTESEFSSEEDIAGKKSVVVKCNHTITIQNTVEEPSGAGGTRQSFNEDQRDIPIAISYMRGGLLEEESGLVPTGFYQMWIPANYALSEGDRIQAGIDYLRIDAIDRLAFKNIMLCTASKDRRI